jgi:hypothetical protein
MYNIQEYIHRFWTKFEHEFDFGGDSGHSGGIFVILWHTIYSYLPCASCLE